MVGGFGVADSRVVVWERWCDGVVSATCRFVGRGVLVFGRLERDRVSLTQLICVARFLRLERNVGKSVFFLSCAA